MNIKDKLFSIEIWHDIEQARNDDIEFHLIYKGNKYFGWAFTIDKIKEVMNNHKKSGESANGIYFWASGLLILEEITAESLRASIFDLITDSAISIDEVLIKL